MNSIGLNLVRNYPAMLMLFFLNRFLILFEKTITLLACCLILFFSCKNNETSSAITSEEKTSKAVSIQGNSDDPKALDYLNVLAYNDFFGGNYKDLSQKRMGDSLILSLNNLKQSQLLEIMAFGDSAFYNFKVFATPGDSVNFELKNGEWVFEGKNSAHYNFFKQKEMIELNWPQYVGDIEDYKESCKSIYEQKIELFHKYITDNQNVSEEFISAVKSELKFEYLYNLISPRDVKSGIEGLYTNNVNGIFSSINDEFNTEEKGFFDAKNYFDDIKLGDFQKPDLVTNDYFKRSMVEYIRHYFINQELLDYSKATFVEEKMFIENNFTDELRNYAIGRLITDYHRKGFGNNLENIKLMKKVIIQYSDKSSDPSYVKILDSINRSLETFNLQLPKEIFDGKVVNLEGDTLSINDVFNSVKGKIKVLDFWASWCYPCLKEITQAVAFRKELSSNENVSFIYFSVDNDRSKWVTKSQQLKENINTVHQYLLLDKKNSVLLRFLRVNAIPKYTILDSNGVIMLDNAPNPSDSTNFKRIIDEINTK